MDQLVQSQERIQQVTALEVQWFTTAIAIIIGMLMILDTVSTVVRAIGGTRGIGE